MNQTTLQLYTEILLIELKLKGQENLFIGALFGKQESQHYKRTRRRIKIEKSVHNYTKTNSKIILVGNFYGKIDNDENRITHGETSTTTNYKIISLMVRTLKLRHFKQICQMSRKMDKSQYQNGNEKSIIDYAICSKAISKNIMKVLIDD